MKQRNECTNERAFAAAVQHVGDERAMSCFSSGAFWMFLFYCACTKGGVQTSAHSPAQHTPAMEREKRDDRERQCVCGPCFSPWAAAAAMWSIRRAAAAAAVAATATAAASEQNALQTFHNPHTAAQRLLLLPSFLLFQFLYWPLSLFLHFSELCTLLYSSVL